MKLDLPLSQTVVKVQWGHGGVQLSRKFACTVGFVMSGPLMVGEGEKDVVLGRLCCRMLWQRCC